MSFLANTALLLAVLALLPIGGVIFAPFLVGLYLLALVGVSVRHSDGRVGRREASMDPKGWRSER